MMKKAYFLLIHFRKSNAGFSQTQRIFMSASVSRCSDIMHMYYSNGKTHYTPEY